MSKKITSKTGSAFRFLLRGTIPLEISPEEVLIVSDEDAETLLTRLGDTIMIEDTNEQIPSPEPEVVAPPVETPAAPAEVPESAPPTGAEATGDAPTE